MKISIKLDHTKIRQIEQSAREAAKESLEAVYTNLVSSGTMPFDTGDMQNNQTFVLPTLDGGASLVTGSPQARRLYYHPEYNFQRGKNANAGAYWLAPYINGSKKDFVRAEFVSAFKRRAGV